MPTPPKHFLQFKDLSKAEIDYLFERTRIIKDRFQRYERHWPLQDRTLVMIFEKQSTRTRLSFEAGMSQLGGSAIYLNTRDTQLGRGEPVEVVTRPDGDDVLDLVAVDGLADAAADEIEAREREEAKRLVYVAFTRARDRLYLATTIARQGGFAPATSALGAVLPASLGAALAAAASAEDAVAWTSASGHLHALRVIRAGDDAVAAAPPAPARHDDFAPLALAGGRPDTVSARSQALQPGDLDGAGDADREAARAIGRLVHRAIAAGALAAAPAGRPTIVQAVAGSEPPATQARAVAVLDGLAVRADVVELISGAHVQHEVPMSVRGADGVLVHAVVDMLVHGADGRITVVEFKTGAARPGDEHQLAAYADAVRQLDPRRIVESRLIRVHL